MPPWFFQGATVAGTASSNTTEGAWDITLITTTANTVVPENWTSTQIQPSPLPQERDLERPPQLIPDCRQRTKPTLEAERVAMDTLREMLSRDEWRALRRDRKITVPSKLHPTRLYVVTEKARVLVQEGGKTVEALCFHPPNEEELPMGDRLLTRVFLLQHDEARVLRVANRHRPDSWYARGEPIPAAW